LLTAGAASEYRVGMSAVLMVQGTASHAGKSTLVTALCRIFAQDGYRVAPFKAQNMSLNAAVTLDGGEIGRAQYTQAEAARAVPSVRMNPILLKPTDTHRSQIVVLGRPVATEAAASYYERKAALWPVVAESLDALRSEYDIVVIEGAGSPAEINLAAHDIVNMRVARHAGAPVILVGDIERGGVFAALYGTVMLLPPEERALIKGFVINKFRGDVSLLDPGFAMLESRTGVPTLGVLGYRDDFGIPEEDSLGLPAVASTGAAVVEIAVIRFPHLANFDDFDPLARERGVAVRYVDTPESLGDPDLIVLPGTKTTVADLGWMRGRGLDRAIIDRRSAGTPVLGICGGYQMLGRAICDPQHVESSSDSVSGLGLLPVTTIFESMKATHQVAGRVTGGRGVLGGARDTLVRGYEIHMGRTTAESSWLSISERDGRGTSAVDGTADEEGLTVGTYVHGVFGETAFRRAVLGDLAARRGVMLALGEVPRSADAAFDALADYVRERLDIGRLARLAGLTGYR
jgi:adenosylcobyric acid synthase